MSSTIRSYHHIAIKASDFDRSFRFYTEGLGLVPVFSRGEADKRMAFLELPDGSCVELFAGGAGTEPAGGWTHLAFRVDSAEAAFEAALAAGGTPRNPPADGLLAGKPADIAIRTSFVLGPDREVIEFFELR
ncbi:MAG: VOC family protein [Clostridia bacterium]|nr:VOC family protein [Clostridia bacterium]